jgi:hypothetical protein
MYERNLIEIFPGLTTALKIYMTFPIMSFEAERSFLNYQQQKINFVQPC